MLYIDLRALKHNTLQLSFRLIVIVVKFIRGKALENSYVTRQ